MPGTIILNVLARDLDNDPVAYTLLDIANCLEYFYVSPDTGAYSLRKAVFNNPQNEYNVSIAVVKC